jgi:hypothetical protein
MNTASAEALTKAISDAIKPHILPDNIEFVSTVLAGVLAAAIKKVPTENRMHHTAQISALLLTIAKGSLP